MVSRRTGSKRTRSGEEEVEDTREEVGEAEREEEFVAPQLKRSRRMSPSLLVRAMSLIAAAVVFTVMASHQMMLESLWGSLGLTAEGHQPCVQVVATAECLEAMLNNARGP